MRAAQALCNALQHIAIDLDACGRGTPQNTVAHCNRLQQTLMRAAEAHCNKPQHTPQYSTLQQTATDLEAGSKGTPQHTTTQTAQHRNRP